MSIHPSLRSLNKGKQYRSVWKRFERLRKLKKEDRWDEKEDSVFGLPKLKIIKAKMKKYKATAEKEADPEAVNAPEEEAAQEAKPKEKREEDKEDKKK